VTRSILRYSTVEELRSRLVTERREGKKVGFLATMGALHSGHLELANTLREHCEIRVCSVFVNPTQFNDPKDYEAYLINVDVDERALESQGVDILFAPSSAEMYPAGSQTTVMPGLLSLPLEGEFRPGHFTGVCTVVLMLLSIVEPHVTIFGEKDFQQLRLVEQMVSDFKLPVKVLRGELVRESDGLALSSRNARLSPESRQHAVAISRGLFAARDAFVLGERNADVLEQIVRAALHSVPDFVEEYIRVVREDTLLKVAVVEGACRLLVVVRIQGVRLLDNIALN
jgi:pantoate--beta-alanine ligase